MFIDKKTIIQCMENMNLYKKFAIDLAKEAGQILLDNFNSNIKAELKKDTTLVTEIDIRVNDLLLHRIKEKFPEHGVMGEEKSDLEENQKYIWACDPLDGTKQYLLGIPVFCVSIALLDGGAPVLGVIYDPYLDRMCVAVTGEGTQINGKKLAVSSEELDKSIIATSVSRKGIVDLWEARKILRDKGLDVEGLTSTAYFSMLVASGKVAGIIYPFSETWDVAATKIIIEEAGGKTSDIFGNEQNYDGEIRGFIGSNGLVHEELVELVKNSLEKDK